MATDAQRRRAYVQALKEVSQRYGNLEADTRLQILDLLDLVRKELAAEIVRSDFDQYRVNELSQAITSLSNAFNSQATRLITNGIQQSSTFGMMSVVEPLTAAGMMGLGNAPSISQVNTLIDFSVDLVRGISDDLNSQLTRQIRLSALGQQTPTQAMKEITRILGLRAGRRQTAKGIAYRAEMIARTELNRALNISSHAQQQATAQQFPEVRKRWLHSGKILHPRRNHLALHAKTEAEPIPVNEPFRTGGVELMYPGDPAAPAKETVNCGCRTIVVWPEIGILRTPLDRQVGSKLEELNNE